ncbi:hypothetical protein ACQI4F_04990 [Mycolicibacterium vaccae]|uniref:hypothetical protein n=1 Tax=Mycolicibacterium vaccae TaxID=1810 RepID=UPI003CE88497
MTEKTSTEGQEPEDTRAAEVAETDVEDAPAEETEAGQDATNDDAADEDVTAAPPQRGGRPLKLIATAAVLAVALLASAGLAAWLYTTQYRPDQETDEAAQKVVLDAATSGTVALLSYSPESLDADFAAAKARLTGDFLSYYTQFTEQIVTPAAKEKQVKTAASVVRSGVSQMAPEKAEVLVFINQTTTSKENPDGAFAASSVRVGMKKIDDSWLIESFDPV